MKRRLCCQHFGRQRHCGQARQGHSRTGASARDRQAGSSEGTKQVVLQDLLGNDTGDGGRVVRGYRHEFARNRRILIAVVASAAAAAGNKQKGNACKNQVSEIVGHVTFLRAGIASESRDEGVRVNVTGVSHDTIDQYCDRCPMTSNRSICQNAIGIGNDAPGIPMALMLRIIGDYFTNRQPGI